MMVYMQINTDDILLLNEECKPQQSCFLPKVETCPSEGSHVVTRGKFKIERRRLME